jgi:hypothetical protein
MIVRFIAFTIALAGALLFSRAPAEATIEYCPAEINGLHSLATVKPGLFSYNVFAESARTVGGNVLVETPAGWFTFPFSGVQVAPDVEQLKNSYVSFKRTEYRSGELFVQFPPNVTHIVMSWVSDAQAKGDGAFGWEARGDVPCSPLGGVRAVAKHPDPDSDVSRVNPDPVNLDTPPASGDRIATAVTATPPPMDCPQPFVPASVKTVVPPAWPPGISINRDIETIVKVAIGPNGQVDDAWIYQPSGLKQFDDAAVAAAVSSTYIPAVAVCKPVPGTYAFKAHFQH